MAQSFKTGDVVVLTKPTDLGRCTKTVRSVSADGKTVELDWFIVGDCNSGSFPVGDVRLATDAERKAMQSLSVCGDTASDLADQIMALINSKPRSPTKDELVAVLAPVIAPVPTYLVPKDMAAQVNIEVKPGAVVAVSPGMMHRDLLPVPIDQAGIIKAFEARYGTVDTSIPSDEPLKVKWHSSGDLESWKPSEDTGSATAKELARAEIEWASNARRDRTAYVSQLVDGEMTYVGLVHSAHAAFGGDTMRVDYVLPDVKNSAPEHAPQAIAALMSNWKDSEYAEIWRNEEKLFNEAEQKVRLIDEATELAVKPMASDCAPLDTLSERERKVRLAVALQERDRRKGKQ